MDTIILMMLIFWGALLVFAWRLRAGLGFLGDAVAGMTGFMLGKALGPGATILEGRSGTASASWINHGIVWLFIGASITFIDLWLGHSPNALYSLQSWSWDLTGNAAYTPSIMATFGGMIMLLIGSSLHIIPRMADTPLSNETNAGLMAMVFTGGILLFVIGSQVQNDIGNVIAFAGYNIPALAALAIIANLLLTIRKQTTGLEAPQWFIIIGLVGWFVSSITFVVLGPDAAPHTLWISEQLHIGMFLCLIFGVVYYAIPSTTGIPIPSRSLVALTLVGTVVTVSPMGYDPASLSFLELAWLPLNLGVTAGASFPPCGAETDCTSSLVITTLMALSIPVMFMFSTNVLTAIRRSGAIFEDTALTLIAFGAFMLPIMSITSLFTTLDAMSGSNELSAAIGSVRIGAVWGAIIPLALGGALAIIPDATGKDLESQSSGIRAIWILGLGIVGAFMVSMMSDFAEISFAEAGLEEGFSSTAAELRPIASVLFYGVVLGVLFLAQNVVRGTRSVDTEPEFSILGPSRYVISGSTTVRDLLTAGVTLDTILTTDDGIDDSVGPTKLFEEE